MTQIDELTPHEMTRDEMISRIVDGDATQQQWESFEWLAQKEAAHERSLWRELAEAQRHDAALQRAVERAVDAADSISLDHSNPAINLHGRTSRSDMLPVRLGRLGAWGGWAAAAAVAIVASSQMMRQTGNLADPASPGVQKAGGLATIADAADALSNYLAAGREAGTVVGEMPARVLVDTRPDSSGDGYEVLYLRQVLERMVVPNLYEMRGENDLGQPTFVRYQRPAANAM